jgi:hypothetical protein
MKTIGLYFLIIVAMIAIIPFIQNDFIIAGIYTAFALVTLAIKRQKNDLVFLAFGFICLFISEYFFISTGVETFNRHTLLGVMPFWLPFLWAYAFMVIGRCIRILDSKVK